MGRIYLTPKQILILTLPFLLIAYIIFYPNTIYTLLSWEENDVKKNEILDNEKKNMIYYKNLEIIKENMLLKNESIFDKEVYDSSWFIAYTYKPEKLIGVVKSQPKLNKTNRSSSLKNISTFNKLQKQLDERNQKIKNNLDNKKNNIKANDFITVSKDELQYINKLIKQRNIKIKVDESLKINTSLYNLQMIFHAGSKSKVIINNNIYKRGQLIDNGIKIVKIKTDKILIENTKESKWLYLNK